MAKLMKNGEITHINESIVDDMETLLNYIDYLRWNDKDSAAANAALRIKDYLADYKLEDNHD